MVDSSEALGGIYRDQKVLVTGHTGFKGSWLSTWLVLLGAEVIGYSAYHPSTPSHFTACRLADRVIDVTGDVTDFAHLQSVFTQVTPDIVFHLAAQPIVRKSYDEPKQTFEINVGGTLNVLECLRTTAGVKAAVIITSDKCYENMEWPWGYRETDRLGGRDPYSASKACAEIACHAYARSLTHGGQSVRLATARAGNVIGGGDWAQDRIIPDCVRAWSKDRAVLIRNPDATRPWQHVLEPLSGYLWLGANLVASRRNHGEAFNFGPATSGVPVAELIKTFSAWWKGARWEADHSAENKGEDAFLQLACEKARHVLKWHTVLPLEAALRLTGEWYRAYYDHTHDLFELSSEQIAQYTSHAAAQRLPWALGELVHDP